MNKNPTENSSEENSSRKGFRKYILNIHVLFFVLVAVIIGIIIFRFSKWGKKIDIDEVRNSAEQNYSGRDTFDTFSPLMDEEGNYYANQKPHTVLLFGNSELARDRDSKNGLANLIAEKTGSTVINLAVADSLLATQDYWLKNTSSGIDVYNFYWLCIYLTYDEEELDYFDWLKENPDAKILPETEELKKTLDSIDMNKVDTIGVFYDAADYYAGSPCYNEANTTDIMTFAGNLEAGIEALQSKYPHIRIIVMSPTYAFGVEDSGELVSSDMKIYEGGAILSTYMLRECESSVSRGTSFIDNIYGTFNEDEAPDYLIDHCHLNQAGRDKVAQRFARALTYYDK